MFIKSRKYILLATIFLGSASNIAPKAHAQQYTYDDDKVYSALQQLNWDIQIIKYAAVLKNPGLERLNRVQQNHAALIEAIDYINECLAQAYEKRKKLQELKIDYKKVANGPAGPIAPFILMGPLMLLVEISDSRQLAKLEKNIQNMLKTKSEFEQATNKADTIINQYT